MIRPLVVAAACVGLSACHISIGSSPPPSSKPARQSAPASSKPKPAAKKTAPSSASAKRKPAKKKSSGQKVAANTKAKRTNPKAKGKGVRTNPNTNAKRTNPKAKGKGVRTNPKGKGKRTNPKGKGKRTNPKAKGQHFRVGPVAPPPKGDPGIKVACDFKDGWVAVLPAKLYDPGEEFLMQALIGLQGDPGFWGGLSEYAKYEPHKAQKCGADGVQFDLAAGDYVIAVGMANQFFVRGEYRDNGYVEEVSLKSGSTHAVTLSEKDLSHTWLCISCPYLVVFQDGEAVEAGQVLKDRYTRRRYGTDVVHTQADVRDGVLTVRLDEREPETSYIDAVVVRVDGRTLRPLGSAPKGLRAIDDTTTALKLGDSAVLEFDAARFADGLVDVEIQVSGHYEPIGPLL